MDEAKKRGRPPKRWNGPEPRSEKRPPKKENIDPKDAQLQNVEKGFNLSFDDLPTRTGVVQDPHIFRKNIQFLIAHCGKTKAVIAKEARVPPEWLRQLSRRGLRQIRENSRSLLDRLRRSFLLDSVEELWWDGLIDSLKKTRRREEQGHPFLRSKDWPYAVRFLQLLQSGEYDFCEVSLADYTKTKSLWQATHLGMAKKRTTWRRWRIWRSIAP